MDNHCNSVYFMAARRFWKPTQFGFPKDRQLGPYAVGDCADPGSLEFSWDHLIRIESQVGKSAAKPSS